ncbi:MAG: 16S rRNA (adenine(1518)-N(6)/adenine(1519)-N(6))-dimethyltransferase RsmA [Terracidiphilus sp.]|jgi:16S rRNA (adenine1518-N6/adenine1519-N6)-dimethyltransferase
MPAKPKLGQNFLNDAQAIERIAASLGDLSGRTVVEIGPGAGAITGALAARAAHVLAVELDPGLAAYLRARFPSDRVTVLQQDALNFDFAAASASAGQRLAVFGNLPYGITSQILLKLADSHAALDRAVLMVQREVADRITARPGSRDYGLLSVTVQMYGPAEKLFTLPPQSFSPPPDVHSTVFRWRFAPRFVELGLEEAGFLPFVRKVFAQKRKTLLNNLRASGIPPAAAAAALAHAAIDPRARAEALPIEALAALWHSLKTERAASPGKAAPPFESSSN